jgi:peptide-methionine (S)-S-oxide reductase
VIRTRVGYAGGTSPNPTYHDLGDHTESVQIDFDPEILSFSRLLDMFWASHDATRQAWSRQYASLIFFHSKTQEEEAVESRNRHSGKASRPVITEILPFTGFTRAEDYHQKFYLRRDFTLMRIFRELFPEERALVDSTASARVNGFLAGFGDPLSFMSEIPLWGFPPEAWERVRRIAKGRL